LGRGPAYIRHPDPSELDALKDAFERGVNFSFSADNGEYLTDMDGSPGTRDILNHITDKLNYLNHVATVEEVTRTPDTLLYPFLDGVVFDFTGSEWRSPGFIDGITSPASCVINLNGDCHVAWLPNEGSNGFLFASGNAVHGSETYLENLIDKSCGLDTTTTTTTSSTTTSIAGGRAPESTASLLACWSFNTADGSDASTAVDIVGGHNGDVGGATQVDSPRGQSYSFDGGSDKIDVTDFSSWSLDPQTEDFTIGTWVELDDISNPHDIIFDMKNDGSVRLALEHYGASSDGWVMHDSGSNPPVSNILAEGSVGTSADTWVYLTLVREGSAWRLYKDGVLLAENLVAGDSFQNPDHFIMGFSEDINSDESTSLAGELDEFAVWDGALSATEVNEYLNAGATCSVAWQPEVCDGLDNNLDGYVDEGMYACNSTDADGTNWFTTTNGEKYCFACSDSVPYSEASDLCQSHGVDLASYLNGD